MKSLLDCHVRHGAGAGWDVADSAEGRGDDVENDRNERLARARTVLTAVENSSHVLTLTPARSGAYFFEARAVSRSERRGSSRTFSPTGSGSPTLWRSTGAGGENPHCHLVISERSNDGLERTAETWFKRYNGKAPERGGARKCSTSSKEWLPFTRCDRDLDRHVLRGAGPRGGNAQVGLGGRQPGFGRNGKPHRRYAARPVGETPCERERRRSPVCGGREAQPVGHSRTGRGHSVCDL